MKIYKYYNARKVRLFWQRNWDIILVTMALTVSVGLLFI